MTEYDPCWPFPQYDETGKQILPPKTQPPKNIYPDDLPEAPF